MSNDGGPAFAAIATSPSDDVFHQPGMTLRDYFAAKALLGILSGPGSRNGVPAKEWFDIPVVAYQIADAMLNARAALTKAEGHIGQELAPDPERRVNGNANGDEK